MASEKLKYELEILVDETSIGEIVDALVEICHDKADLTWDTKSIAKAWINNAVALNQAQAKLKATF